MRQFYQVALASLELAINQADLRLLSVGIKGVCRHTLYTRAFWCFDKTLGAEYTYKNQEAQLVLEGRTHGQKHC